MPCPSSHPWQLAEGQLKPRAPPCRGHLRPRGTVVWAVGRSPLTFQAFFSCWPPICQGHHTAPPSQCVQISCLRERKQGLAMGRLSREAGLLANRHPRTTSLRP